MDEKELQELKDRLVKSRQTEDIRALIEAVGLEEATIFLFSNTNWR